MGEVEKVGLAKSERLARTLAEEIRGGAMRHGDRLDSEGALMQRFDVSRNTVRRGLGLLARQGLITTRTGIGSFVTYEGNTIDDRKGWSVALAGASGPLVTRVLDVRRGLCGTTDAFLAKRGLPAAGDYLCIDRLRLSETDGRGVSLERSRLPWRAALAIVTSSGLTEGVAQPNARRSGARAGLGRGDRGRAAGAERTRRGDDEPRARQADAAVAAADAGSPTARCWNMSKACSTRRFFGLRMTF